MNADLVDYDLGHGTLVAGADEAGRGCFAGPLVAAAVLLDYDALSPAATRELLAGLNDSKKLSAKKREQLYPQVLAAARQFAVIGYSAARIDREGLHACNLRALAEALGQVARPQATLLADGFKGLPAQQGITPQQVIRGDQTSAAIAAASIIAKVTRDHLMMGAHEKWPGYGFDQHAGYGTRAHQAAIAELGLCPIHRRSFKGVGAQA